jgi:multisubunit Na+/H+ antiporter MnhC subunit
MADGYIDLSPIINKVEQVGFNLERKIDVEVGSVRSDLKVTRDELNDLKKAVSNYVDEYKRIEAVQRAEIKKNTVAAEIDREFGHYRVVRRTSVGTLQALDIGNVTDSTVQQISEELMIQTPKYWLAPAIVAVAAWTRDDKEISEKSVNAAFSRDKAKTALFFALVLRREGRLEAATAWLKVYFTSMDPKSLGREFAVILECITSGAFGAEGIEFVTDKLQEWNALLREDEDEVSKQIAKWQDSIKAKADVPDVKQYEDLKILSPDWPKLEAQLISANGLFNFKNEIDALKDKTVVKNTKLVELLDDILERLVREYDVEELPRRREIAALQAVIDSEGREDEGKILNELSQSGLEEKLSLLQIQGVCVFAPETIGVGIGTTKAALGASRDIAREAVSKYSRDYREKAIHQANLVFDEKHSNYAQTYNYVGYRTTTAASEETDRKGVTDAWMATFAIYIESLKFNMKKMVAPIVIAAIITALFFIGGPVVGLVVLAIAACIVYLIYKKKKSVADQAIADAEKVRADAIAYSIKLYNDAKTQWVDAMLVYEDLDIEEDGLIKTIDTWADGKQIYGGGEDE